MLKYIRKWLYSINKENLSCWDKNIMGYGKFLNLYWRNYMWKLNLKSNNNKKKDTSCIKCVVELCYIFFNNLTQPGLFVAFSKVNQWTCQVLNMAAF
jgi:hypothetical protein